MLDGTNSLAHLSMAYCKIMDDGFNAISDGLERNNTLKSLALSHNLISD